MFPAPKQKYTFLLVWFADLVQAWWISFWTRSYESKILLSAVYISHASTGSAIRTELMARGKDNSNLPFYLGIYVGISVVICIFGTCRYFFVFIGSMKASRTLFDKLTYTILRAPLRWLDTVPVGRILNRFTADFVVVDSKMGSDLVGDLGALLGCGEQYGLLQQVLSPRAEALKHISQLALFPRKSDANSMVFL